MKRVTKLEIVFGLFALALIYFVIANNASITGFVISPATSITLVAPTDNTQTKATSVYFMFKYPAEIEVNECSLILNGEIAKTATGLLSPYDTRIRMDLVSGNYIWSIECIDTSGLRIVSDKRLLIIGEKEESELKITSFRNRDGFIYEFEIKENLELNIDKVMPNDVIRAKQGENTYEIHILRVIQDYSLGIGMTGLMIIPGDKRMNLHEEESVWIDFNNDGKNDVELTLKYISYKKAYFTVSTKQESNLLGEAAKAPVIKKVGVIINPIEEQESVEAEQQQPILPPEKKKAAVPVELLIIVLIVILAIALILKTKSKQEEEKEYISKLKRTAMTKVKKKVKKAKKKIAKKKAKKKRKVKKKKKKKKKKKPKEKKKAAKRKRKKTKKKK